MTYLIAAVLTVIIVIGYNKLVTPKKMKAFTIKANLLGGLTHTVNQLTPTEKAKCADDAVEGNRLAVKAIADCEKANANFLEATKGTYEKKKAFYDEHRAELTKAVDGRNEAEVAKLTTDASLKLKEELDKIDAASTANPDEDVTVTVSDEKLTALKKLLRSAVGQWENSELYVATADALDEAKDA